MGKKILISVGGTGGHLFPAQSLAEQLSKEDYEFLFVGSKLSSNPYFNPKKFPFKEIEASSLSIRDGLKIFSKMYALFKGTLQSIRILKKFKPDLIIAFGSFHTLPLLMGAKLLKKKYYLHEQNIYLGRVNRLFAAKSNGLISPYPKTVPFFPHRNIMAQMPLKFWKQKLYTKEEARLQLGLDSKLKTILVFGGSQGAQFINEIFLQALPLLRNSKFQVIHILGKNFAIEKAEAEYRSLGLNVYLKTFESEMHTLLSAATFCISRSGASTLAEQVELQLPSIHIPYPHASNHQEHNADYMQDQVGGGIKLLENDLNASLLAKICQNFLNDTTLMSYVDNIKNFKRKEKAQSFPNWVKQEVQSHERK